MSEPPRSTKVSNSPPDRTDEQNMAGEGYGVYYFLRFLTRIIMLVFFRDVEIIGVENIPISGGVILAGNHFNQFVDGMLLMTACPRPVVFIAAAKSMKRPFIGWFGRKIKALPVVRPQDEAKPGPGKISVNLTTVMGTDTKFTTTCEVGGSIMVVNIETPARIEQIVSDTEIILSDPFPALLSDVGYKCLRKVDQKELFQSVWNSLHDGNCIGIFPEGGSHDRSDLLPLKAGIAIMSLGYVDRYQEQSVIVPCGFTYFQGDRFRGQVVIEFGPPVVIPPEAELVELYKTNRKTAFSQFLKITKENMEAVAVTAPSYDDLCAFHTARKIYQAETGQVMKPTQRAQLLKKMSYYYRTTSESDEMKMLKERLLEFKARLDSLGIMEGQLRDLSTSYWKALPLLLYRLLFLVTLFLLSLPGVLVNIPAGLVCQHLADKEMKSAKANSNVKIEGKDVVASYKLIVGFLVFPLLYFVYTIISIFIVAFLMEGNLRWVWPVVVFVGLPFFSYASVKVAENWVMLLSSLPPLILLINPFAKHKRQELIRLQEGLFQDVNKFVGRARSSLILTTPVVVARNINKVVPSINESEEKEEVEIVIKRSSKV